MKIIIAIFVICFVEFAAAGGDDLCGKFTVSALKIHQQFEIAAKILRENSFLLVEKVFNNNTMTVEQKQTRITTLLEQSKTIFDNLEEDAYKDLGVLIGKDPGIIAKKMLHSVEITEFPFICVMKDADYISITSNTIQRSVADYANKISAEL